MNFLLDLSHFIDALNERVGRAAFWLVLLATLVSAGNALARYGLNASSNAWLEIQWYLFSLTFLLGAGYTLKHGGHVRIDLIYNRLSERGRAWVDLLGSVLFLLPLSLLMAWLGWEYFVSSWAIRETSPDAGGLARWPVKMAIPAGFFLLALQGLSEAIKRAVFLFPREPS